MRTLPRHSTAAGFTLIELLTVIAIIGILAAIFIPTIGVVREKAQRAVDANNLREIVKAAMIYAGDHNDRLPDPRALATAGTVTGGTAVYLWPGILAKTNVLSDPTFYFARNDPLFGGTYPTAVLNPTDPTRQNLDATFAAAPLAWEFVGGLRMGDPASTPVAYTRGLQANGTWDIAKGVYKDTGGFIAFLGGNVVFHPNTAALFTSNRSGAKVTDLRQAIPYVSSTSLARLYGTNDAILGTPNGSDAQQGE